MYFEVVPSVLVEINFIEVVPSGLAEVNVPWGCTKWLDSSQCTFTLYQVAGFRSMYLEVVQSGLVELNVPWSCAKWTWLSSIYLEVVPCHLVENNLLWSLPSYLMQVMYLEVVPRGWVEVKNNKVSSGLHVRRNEIPNFLGPGEINHINFLGPLARLII